MYDILKNVLMYKFRWLSFYPWR